MSNCDCESCTQARLDRQFFNEVALGLNPEPSFLLTLSKARALYRELEKSYINQENPLAVAVVMDLGKFIDRFGSSNK